MSQVEVEIPFEDEENAFIVSEEEHEKAGLWEPGCYHLTLDGFDKVIDEVREGDHAGKKYAAFNIRWSADEVADYNEEGYYTETTTRLDPPISRFQKIHVQGPFAKKGREKMGSLMFATLGNEGAKAMKDPVTGAYDYASAMERMVNSKVWNYVGQFKDDGGLWRDYNAPHFTSRPARKIRKRREED